MFTLPYRVNGLNGNPTQVHLLQLYLISDEPHILTIFGTAK